MTDVTKEEHELLNSQHPDIYHLCSLARKMHSEGMMAYLVMMSSRMLECHRILKETGTLYFHCDHTANAYIRMLLDAIFKPKNYLNEIIWHHPKIGVASNKFTSNTDTILSYAKNKEEHKFNPQTTDEPNELFTRWKRKIREGVLYYSEAKTINDSPAKSKIRVLEKKLGRKLRDDDVVVDFNLPENMKAVDNVLKIPFLKGNSNEKTGWSTQKPVALYSRFILASSNPGDVVLDPFCGCSTTLVAAENAGRQWIGIDRDPNAEQMVQGQLGKLAGQTPEFWRKQVIIRKCFDQHKEWPVRDDLEKIPHYKKHFDRLYRQQSGICPGCNWHRDAHVMTVDHDLPRIKGGRDNVENLRALCSGCNSAKGTKTLAQLIARNKKKGIWNDGLYGRELPIDLTDPPPPNPTNKPL